MSSNLAEQEKKYSFIIEDNEIYIPGHVPSSKNSKQIVHFGKSPRLIDSEQTLRYRKEFSGIWNVNKHAFHKLIQGKEKPYKIGFYFIRNDKRAFDYINPAQMVQDIMVSSKWIEDDNCNEMIPVFIGHHVDKSEAGVIISVL